MRSISRRAGFVAGGLATLALVGVLRPAAALTGLAFVPDDLADLLIRLTPGALATAGIEALGALAKLFVKLAAITAIILLGGGLGAWARDARRANTAATLLLLVLLLLPLLNRPATAASALAPPALLTVLALVLLWRAALPFLAQRLSAAHPQAPPTVTDRDRRVFLVRAGAVTLTLAVGGTALAELLERPADEAALPATLPPASRITPEAPFDAGDFVAPPGVRPRITPQAELYYVASRARDPRVDARTYRLSITGNVAHPRALTLDEIMRRPRVYQTSTLECISNEVGGPLIGNCRWVGTPLAELLRDVGVGANAQRVALYGADGYVDSISLDDALKPTTLLVYGVDDQPLTVPHGYPLRLIVPNIFGMKNVKWLERIEVVNGDFQGFWQQRGWSQSAIVLTTSVVDTRQATRAGDLAVIGGIAFAGSRGIQRVEVQIDGGSWQAATLEPAASPLQWRRWRYAWPAAPGRYQVRVRAVDGTGALQSATLAPPHPNGASGYHVLVVSVA